MTERTAKRLRHQLATWRPLLLADDGRHRQNLTKPPYCIGKQPCGELANKGSPGLCLEVQNGAFSGSACGNGALSSHIWIYACNTDGLGQVDGRSQDCPQHENVQWRLTGKFALRRACCTTWPHDGTMGHLSGHNECGGASNTGGLQRERSRQHWIVTRG